LQPDRAVWFQRIVLAGAVLSGWQSKFGNLQFSGIAWLLVTVALLLLLRPSDLVVGRARMYMAFLIYASFSAALISSHPLYQELAQLTVPIVAYIAGHAVGRSPAALAEQPRLNVLAIVALYVPMLMSLAGMAVLSKRPAAITMVYLGTMMLAHGFEFGRRYWLGWAATVFFCTVTGSRTAAATLMVIACLFFNRMLRPSHRVLAFVVLAGIGLAVVTSKTFLSRMFYEMPHSSEEAIEQVEAGNINTSGRLNAWAYLWHVANREPVFGQGQGEARYYSLRVWDAVMPHNDYLRIFLEFGAVGLASFWGFFLVRAISLWRASRTPLRRQIGYHGFALVCGLAILALTDNPISYTAIFTMPLFLTLGCIDRRLEEEDQLERDEPVAQTETHPPEQRLPAV
jgi:O-antigen ligase